VLVGASPKRKEDGRFVTGQGRYLDDVRVPGLLHVALVRSPHAHARVVSIDHRAARALAGVAAVWTLDDLPELAVANVPPLVPEPKSRPYVHPIMAGQRARHVGEIVAIVIADDPYVAADGAERVAMAYEPLPAALSPESAVAPGAPRVNEAWPDNLVSVTASAKGHPESAMAGAEVVVAARLAYPRVAGMPLETRGVLAAPDPVGGGLTVWTSTQVPFAVRSGIAPVVGLQEERIRVLVPDVGGGFGVKGHVYPEEILVPVVARRLGRPVKWTETRSEHCLTAAGFATRSTRRGSGFSATAASWPSTPRSPAITGPPRCSARPSRSTPSTTSPGRTTCRTTAGSAGTSSPTRPSPPPTGAPAGPRPPSCWTGCWIARRAGSAWTRPSCGGGT